MSRITALIADDEPLARERIRSLLGKFQQVEIVAECADGREALKQIRRTRPGLVFLDVQMPEMDGFEVLGELEPELTPAVIFVTAYDAFALRAFEVHAVDYLLKPFTRARFTRAIEHVLDRVADPHPTTLASSQLRALLDSVRKERGQERLAIRTEEGVCFVRTTEIDWAEAAGNYVKIHAGAHCHQLRDTLKNLEAKLDPARFVRVHRSALVNVDSIQRLEPWFHGEFVVVLRDGTRLMSSRTYSDRLHAMVR